MIGEGWRGFVRRILHPFRGVRDEPSIDMRYNQLLNRIRVLERRIWSLERRVSSLEEKYRRLFRVE